MVCIADLSGWQQPRETVSHDDDYLPVALTPELLDRGEVDWRDEVERFEPLDHEAGREAAAWLQKQVQEGCPSYETWVLYSESRGILGFFALAPMWWRLPRDVAAIINVRRRPQLKGTRHLGLHIMWIARDASTNAGFGRELVLGAIQRARIDPQYVALFVDPANSRVKDLWQDEYHFRNVDRGASQADGRLWLPVDPAPDVTFG